MSVRGGTVLLRATKSRLASVVLKVLLSNNVLVPLQQETDVSKKQKCQWVLREEAWETFSL